MSAEPPPPVWIPPIVQHTHRGICWSDVVADIEKDNAEREAGAAQVIEQEAV